MEKFKRFLKLYAIRYTLYAILLLASFLRLWRISEYMTFLGDEGRDSLVVWKIVTFQHLTLIGPPTSVGSMYLGPFYYYLMAPFLWIAQFNPVGPAIMVALFGVASVYLVYLIGKEFFNSRVGLIAALFYAISPVVITFSHSSWNPNIMPFFALLLIYSLFKLAREKKYHWLLVVSFSLAVALQSHYLGLLLIPLIIWEWIAVFRKTKETKHYILYTGYSILIFLILFAVPLIWFDLRHNFLNSRAFISFVQSRESTGLGIGIIKRLIDNLTFLFERLILVKEKRLVWPFIIFLSVSLIQWFREEKDKIKRKNFKLLFLWLGIGLLGLGFYKKEIYDHYLGFLFPLPFLLTAKALDFYFNKKMIKFLSLGLIIGLVLLNFYRCPLRFSPNRQLNRTKSVSRRILQEAGDQPVNMALIADKNYHAAYQYFVEVWGSKVYKADNKITEQLFVVCENELCEPIGHPLWEIASFGWAKIEKEWQFPWGTRLFKLIHNPEG